MDSDIASCIKDGDFETLVDLLKLPGLSIDSDVCLDQDRLKSLRTDFTCYDDDNTSLISIAAECGSNEILNFLIKLLQLNLKPLRYDAAAEITQSALSNEENLLTLLENDFPVPEDSDLELTVQLREIQSDRIDFADAIANGNLIRVQEFTNKYPNIKVGYLPDGGTAINHALKYKKLEIYAYLYCNGFIANEDDERLKVKELTSSHKETVQRMCKKFYGRPVDSHIIFIWSKTRLGFRTEIAKQNERFDKIKYFLDKLNAVPAIIPILRLMELTSSLMIVFDFDRTDISRIDFPATSNELGCCYSNLGHLYIAGKGPDEVVMGTLIHELCHYAMDILFRNNSKPFAANDSDENERIFCDIVREYEKQEHDEVIISRVFKKYSKAERCKELIVRVPQLMITYPGNPLLKELEMKYERLFRYYENEVLTKIRTVTKWHIDVFETNQILGHLHSYMVNYPNAIINNPEALDIQANPYMFIITDIPTYTVATLIRSLKYPIIVHLIDLNDSYKLGIVKSTCCQSIEIDLVIECRSVTAIPNKVSQLFKAGCIPGKVFFVCEEETVKEKVLKILPRNSNTATSKMKYFWNDLTLDHQLELFKATFWFQEHKIRLSEIIDLNPDLSLIPLGDLVKGIMKIGQPIPVSIGYEYYIERRFINAEHEDITADNTSELITRSQTTKLVMLVDKAGMGKSTSTTHLAKVLKENLKNWWIIRVDLSKNVEFEKMKSIGSANFCIESAANFAGIANMHSTFEGNLFQKFYAAGKVILLFDGIDEILPFLEKKFFDLLLPHLTTSSVNQIWIATRPHVLVRLNKVSWNIDPFSATDFVEFVVKIWCDTPKLSEVTSDEIKKLANILYDFLQMVIRDTALELIGIPLQAKMLADIFKDQVERIVTGEETGFTFSEDFDLLWLYDEYFMVTQINIVSRQKNDAVASERSKMEVRRISMMEKFEKIAIILIERELEIDDKFRHSSAKRVIDEIVMDLEIQRELNANNEAIQRVQRYGIISFDASTEKYYFIHRTYLEYFVSSYIFKALTEPELNCVEKALLILTKTESYVMYQFLGGYFKRNEKKIDIDVYATIANTCHQISEIDYSRIYYWTIEVEEHFFSNFWLKCASYETLISLWRDNMLLNGDITVMNHVCRRASEDNEAELKELLLSDQVFTFIFCYPISSERDLAAELFDIDDLAKNKEHTVDNIDYDYYEANSTLTALFDKAKKVLHRSEQQKLLELIDANHSNRLTVPLIWSRSSTLYFQLRWNIYSEMRSSLDCDANTPTRHHFAKLLRYYSIEGKNLLSICQWIVESFQSDEEKLQWFDELLESFVYIAEKDNFERIMNIVTKHTSKVKILSDVLRRVDFESSKFFIDPLVFLRVVSDTLNKEELKELLYASRPDPPVPICIDEPDLKNLFRSVELYTHETLSELYNEHDDLRAWILLLTFFSKDAAKEMLSFAINNWSKNLRSELMRFLNNTLSDTNEMLREIFDLDGPIKCTMVEKYFLADQPAEKQKVHLNVTYEDRNAIITIDSDKTVSEACRIVKEEFQVDGNCDYELHYKNVWFSRAAFWSRQKLQHYDMVYDLSTHKLALESKIQNLRVIIPNGDMKLVPIDITRSVEHAIDRICSDCQISRSGSYGLYCLSDSGADYVRIYENFRVEETTVCYLTKKRNEKQEENVNTDESRPISIVLPDGSEMEFSRSQSVETIVNSIVHEFQYSDPKEWHLFCWEESDDRFVSCNDGILADENVTKLFLLQNFNASP